MRNTFKAYERLKREQHIDTLFRTGKAFSVFPVRLLYIAAQRPPDTVTSPVLAGFSVPKKKFGSSVKRHRIRRLMVEAWRLNKHSLYNAVPEDRQLHIFFIFTDNTMPDQDTVNRAIIGCTEKLIEVITTNPQSPIPNSKK